MIKIYDNPTVLDFVRICIDMPPDERAQVEAFVGQPFDIDSVAVGNFMVPGPKWVIKDDNMPIVAGGFKQQRPGVWRDYMLTTPQAWEKHWFVVTRVCRRAMDMMLKSKQAHRLECIVPAIRLAQHPKLWGWYELMGYHKEGIRYGYCANGADAIAFSRVHH